MVATPLKYIKQRRKNAISLLPGAILTQLLSMDLKALLPLHCVCVYKFILVLYERLLHVVVAVVVVVVVHHDLRRGLEK